MKALSFKKKTYISFGVIFIFVASSAIVSFFSLNKLSNEYEQTIKNELKIRDVFRQVSVGMLMSRRHEKDYLLRKKDKYIKKHDQETNKILKTLTDNKSSILNVTNPTDFDKALSSVKNYKKGFISIVKAYQAEGNSKEGLRGKMRSHAHKVEELISAEENASTLTNHFLTLRRREKDYLLRRDTKYLNKAKSDIVKFQTDLEGSVQKSEITSEIDSYFSTFQEVTLNYMVIIKTIADFRKDIHAFEGIIKKDIKIINSRIDAKIVELNSLKIYVETTIAILSGVIFFGVFSICIYFARVSNRISGLTSRLKISSDKTNVSSDNVKKAASDVSASTVEQASAIQETVSSLDEIKSMTEKSVGNVTESANSAENSVSTANHGKGKVDDMLTAITDIKGSNQEIIDQMDKNNKQLETIVNIIREISNKTNVINDIVFQTKLLSFNASVEAARAGEHGKGFAVVAEEVGNLANMSGTASKEIESMLSDSITKVNAIFEATKKNVERLIREADLKTEQGVKVANECNISLEEIVEGANVVKSKLNEINEAQREQSAGIANIAEAMNELDQTTHLNSNIANETSGFSNELAVQANELQDIVNSLEKEIEGGRLHLVSKEEVSKESALISNEEKSRELKPKESAPQEAPKLEDTKEVAREVVASKPQMRTITQEIPDSDDQRFEDI